MFKILALLLLVDSIWADGMFQPVTNFAPATFTNSFINQGSASAQQRQGRQQRQNAPVGSIDFSQAQFDADTGKMCVIKEEEVQSIDKEPILECDHKNVEKCHYTYVTQFQPAQEEVCEENFEKTCQITFKKQATTETVKKCYRPLEKVCNGQGPQECRTVYESACTTRYVEKQGGKFVGDTKCEKLPIKICGAGCTTREGPEECHDKQITSLIDIPEEVCDLNPQKTCRLQTRLVPSLKPEHECTIVPQEVCNLKFSSPKLVNKPLLTKWCLDDSPVVRDQTYNEGNALGSPIRGRNSRSFTALDEDSSSSIPAMDHGEGGGAHLISGAGLSFNMGSLTHQDMPFETQQFRGFRDVSDVEGVQ